MLKLTFLSIISSNIYSIRKTIFYISFYNFLTKFWNTHLVTHYCILILEVNKSDCSKAGLLFWALRLLLDVFVQFCRVFGLPGGIIVDIPSKNLKLFNVWEIKLYWSWAHGKSIMISTCLWNHRCWISILRCTQNGLCCATIFFNKPGKL